jgi:peptidoglycan/xylan/chitin deacetylase (PgdA/CDA1 family)
MAERPPLSMTIRRTGLPGVRFSVMRITRIVFGLLTYIVYEVRNGIVTLIGLPSPGTIVPIYYHQVSRENRERFAYQMDHLVRWAKPVSADELDVHTPIVRRVVVTADDGWLSFVENALPELQERNIPVTLFVASHRLGDNLGDRTDRLISKSELLNLPRDLVTVGSHTATHARLTTAEAAQIRWELQESRSRLSELLQTEIGYFCFPFGAHNEETVRLCRAAGYTRAFGSQSTPPAQMSNAFLIERVRVDPTDWPIEFHLKIMGAYRGPLLAATLIKRVLSRISSTFRRISWTPKDGPEQRPQGSPATDHRSDAGY